MAGSAYESRTRVSALRGRCPGPLDECAPDLVSVPSFHPSEQNPGSSPAGSNTRDVNESEIGSTGTKTPVCSHDVSSPDAEHLSPERGRECDCAGLGYIRCIHFDGELIAFYQLVIDGKFRDHWHVCMKVSDNSCGPWFADYDVALTAFYEAEASLLRGGDA